MLKEQVEIENNQKNKALKGLDASNPLLQILFSKLTVSTNTSVSPPLNLRWLDNDRQGLKNLYDLKKLHSYLSLKLKMYNMSESTEQETFDEQEDSNPSLEGNHGSELMLEIRFLKSDEPTELLHFKLKRLDNGCYTLKHFHDHDILHYAISSKLNIPNTDVINDEECEGSTDANKEHSISSSEEDNFEDGLIKLSVSSIHANTVSKIANTNSTIVKVLDIENKFTGEDQIDDEIFKVEDGKYAGEFRKGKKHGQGTQELLDGSRYEGNYEDDKPQGFGEVLFLNGSKYIGVSKNHERNGLGQQIYPSGANYIGEWKDHQRLGCGEETYANGSKYTGEFKDDIINGYGGIIYKDGEKYIGEFKNKLLNGYGEFTYPGGEKYMGEYKDDKQHGYGEFTYAGGEKYMGEYKDDKQHGYGKYTRPNGVVYIGEFENDKRKGVGKYTNPSRGTYVGEWRDNKKNGYGEETYSDGTKFIGEFENNKAKTSKGIDQGCQFIIKSKRS